MRLLSPDRLLGVILIAVLTILLLVVIWSLDRGLDITDESLTLLSYLYPGEYPANFSMSYTIVDRITGWMHPSVVGYRWITLALILLTATAFFCGFWQWLRRFVAAEPRRAVSLAVVFPYLLIGWLSVYGIGLVTLAIGIQILGAMAGLAAYFADVRSITAWLSNYPGQLRVVSQVSHNQALCCFPMCVLPNHSACFCYVTFRLFS